MQVAKKLDELVNWAMLPAHDCYEVPMDPRDALIDAIEFQRERGVRPLWLSVSPEVAMDLAERHPLIGPDNVGGYPRAVSLMFWYQHLLGQAGWFFLSVETLAGLLKCSSRTSLLYLTRAKRETLIEMVRECDQERRRAREWQWVGDVRIEIADVNMIDYLEDSFDARQR